MVSPLVMTKPVYCLLLSILAAGALALAGCRSVPLTPTGDMVAVYRFGEFRMLLNTTAALAAEAAKKAVQDADLYQTSFKLNTYDARLLARSRADQKVLIIIEEVNSRQTLLRIRWGEGGDAVRSRRLYEAIEANLGR
jgi:hypothetical protein